MFRVALLLDDVLIERGFQPIADTLHQQLGLPRLRAACLGLDAAAITWVLGQADSLSNAIMAWETGAAVMRVSMLLLGLTALLSLRSLFRRIAESRGKPNPLRTKMLPHRCLVLLFLVTDLCHIRSGRSDAIADVAMLVFAGTALYLAACAASPPLVRHGPVPADAEAH